MYRDGTLRRDGGKSLKKKSSFGNRFNEWLQKKGKPTLPEDLIEKMNDAGTKAAKDFEDNKEEFALEIQVVMVWVQALADKNTSEEDRLNIVKVGPYHYAKALGMDLGDWDEATVTRVHATAQKALKYAIEKAKQKADAVSVSKIEKGEGNDDSRND